MNSMEFMKHDFLTFSKLLISFLIITRFPRLIINNIYNKYCRRLELNKMSSSFEAARNLQGQMRVAVEAGQFSRADGLFKQLRILLLEFDSLPPLSLDTPNSLAERTLGIILLPNIIQKFIHLLLLLLSYLGSKGIDISIFNI
jgi:hypothetical protein